VWVDYTLVVISVGIVAGRKRHRARDRHKRAIQTVRLDGLWGLAFGNGVQNQPTNTLFFTAGPNAEANGLYGSLMAVPGAMTFTTGDDSDRDDR
jgi:hypothetical protein